MSNRFIDSLTYNLYNSTLNLQKILDKELSFGLNLTFSQFNLLTILENNPSINQRQISQKLQVSEPAVSKQIVILNKKGFVEISLSGVEKNIKLTLEGLETFKNAWKITNLVTNELLKGMDVQSSQQLLDLIKIINSRTLVKLKNYKALSNKKIR